MTEPMVHVADDDVQLAFDRCTEVGIAFWPFVETKPCLSYYNYKDLNFLMPPESAHKVKLLTGPHWRTVIKIMEVQSG